MKEKYSVAVLFINVSSNMSCLQIANFCLPQVIKKCNVIVFQFWILSVRRKGHFITKMAPSSCIKLLIPSVFFLTLLDQMIY